MLYNKKVFGKFQTPFLLYLQTVGSMLSGIFKITFKNTNMNKLITSLVCMNLVLTLSLSAQDSPAFYQ